jgi:hypothetical protein
MSNGHVFVTLGDITHLECDAWMLPTDRGYSIKRHWRQAVEALTDDLIARSKVEAFSTGTAKATPVVDWDERSPLPVLTAVPQKGLRTADDLVELGKTVTEFVGVAERSIRDRAPGGRGKRLFAMPALGTAGGGGALKKGEILDVLLDRARAAATDQGVDIVIVLQDERTFALAQQRRKRHPGQWSALPPEQREIAARLARRVRDGKLVPFMGAGVSISAGGPTWLQLIARLAKEIGLDDARISALKSADRSAPDQAAYLRELYSRDNRGKVAFGEAVVDAVKADRYGLAPILLAALRTEQAITLNYDTLFESASQDVGDARTIIPSGGPPGDRTDKWLLKLHGSVSDPESIVLTREDYLGYSANREALSAIVKANLITHHLLFVGFGLTDDHFHQIIHDVRRAIWHPGADKFGTALMMETDELDEALWGEQLSLVSMGSPRGDVQVAGRQLEIFLDALLAYATDSHSYLLDEGFDSSLTEGQRRLKAKLEDFKKALKDDDDRQDPSWPVIKRMFDELGGST